MKTNSIFFLLTVLFSLSASQAVTSPDNNDFEIVDNLGNPEKWTIFAWNRSREGVEAGITKTNPASGKNAVFIKALDKGAAGFVSPFVSIPKEAGAVRVSFMIRKSASYGGNNPSVFVTFHKEKAYINRSKDFKIIFTGAEIWEKQETILLTDSFPGDVNGLKLNLTTSGKDGKGMLFYDSCLIEYAKDQQIFGMMEPIPFSLACLNTGAFLYSNMPAVFTIVKGNAPADMLQLKGRVYNSADKLIDEVSITRNELENRGWKYQPAENGYYEIEFEYILSTRDKPLRIMESYDVRSPRGNIKTFTTGRHAFARVIHPPSVKERSPLFGFSDQHEPEELCRLADALGFSFSRLHAIPWGSQFGRTNLAIEKSKGDYDFSKLDEHIALLRSFGFMIIGNVLYTPRWASPHPEDTKMYICVPGFAAYAPRRIEDFGDFIRAAAERYKQDIKIWELWNEPHLPGGSCFWLDTPENFAALLANGYTAVKSVQPDAEVLIGGLGGRRYLPFYKKLLSLGGGVYFDTLALHGAGSTPEEFFELDREFGIKPRPWMSSEHHSILINANESESLPSETELARKMILDFCTMIKYGVKRISVFCIRNIIEKESLQFAQKEGWFTQCAGLFRKNPRLEPRLAAVAVNIFINTLGKSVYEGEAAYASGQKICSFKKSDGRHLYILWSDGKTSGPDNALAVLFAPDTKIITMEGKACTLPLVVESNNLYYIDGGSALPLAADAGVLVSFKKKEILKYPVPAAHGISGQLFNETGKITAKNIIWITNNWISEIKNRPEDFNARWAIGASEKFFDIIIEVRDNTFVQSEKPGLYWRGDSVQIAFDTFGKEMPNDQVEFQVALTDEGPCIYKCLIPYIGGDLPSGWTPKNKNIQYGSAFIDIEQGSRIIYRIRIEHTELYPFAYNPDKPVRMSILVNNNNGNGRLGWIEWGAGIGKDKEIAKFGKIFWK